MKINHRRGLAAFTLIELMAVITIIVILAGLVVAGLGFVNERQAKEKARIQIALLSKGLEDYKGDMGSYPGTSANTPLAGSGVSSQIYQSLFYDGFYFAKENALRVPAAASKIYIADLDPTSTRQGWVDLVKSTSGEAPVSTTIKDPWGNEYRYRKGLNAMNPDFDLWSCGKDGRTNPSVPTHKDNNDDIKNF